MIISLIVAIGKHNQIGLDNGLLWSLKDDMKNFKNKTSGHCILMGRKTFESIGRPLPNRTNIIISKTMSSDNEKLFIFKDIKEGIEFAKQKGENELFIIGGSEIYNYFLQNKLVDKIYLTQVDYDGEADAFLYNIDFNDWNVEINENHLANENNQFDYIYKVLIRK